MIENLPPTNQQPSQDLRYAFFYERLIAHTVDSILLMFIIAPLYSFLYVEGISVISMQEADYDNQSPLFFAKHILPLLVLGIYNAIFISSSWHTTPGKRLLGIRVVNEKGNVPTPIEMFMRCSIGYFISSAIFCIGYIMMLFTQKSQGLHDILFKTVVVKHKV